MIQCHAASGCVVRRWIFLSHCSRLGHSIENYLPLTCHVYLWFTEFSIGIQLFCQSHFSHRALCIPRLSGNPLIRIINMFTVVGLNVCWPFRCSVWRDFRFDGFISRWMEKTKKWKILPRSDIGLLFIIHANWRLSSRRLCLRMI